jgi:hypothetical protein
VNQQNQNFQTSGCTIAAAGNGAVSAHLAAIAIDRRNAHQNCNTAALEAAEFGQFGNQRPRCDRATARNGCQKRIRCTSDW